MATELYLVRHGQTEENKKNILQGHMPGHLTETGKRQARRLGKDLAAIPFDAIVCSDLKRCVDTAAILNQPLGLDIEYTELLRERDWGPLTGMSIRQIPKNVDEYAEPVNAMFHRAETFLRDVMERYDGHTVLAVSHGLFCRVIQGAYLGKSIREIPRMDNAEVRHLTLTGMTFKFTGEETTGATAD